MKEYEGRIPLDESRDHRKLQRLARTIPDARELANRVANSSESTAAPFNSENFRKMVRAVVGFHVEVSRLEGKWKLDQNDPRQRRERVARVLERSADPDAREVARLMAEMPAE